MSDFLDALLERALVEKPSIRPRLPATFEPDFVSAPAELEQLHEEPAAVLNASQVRVVLENEESSRQQPAAIPASQITGYQPLPAEKGSVEPVVPLQTVPAPATTHGVDQPHHQGETEPLQRQSKSEPQPPASSPQFRRAAPEEPPVAPPDAVVLASASAVSPVDRSVLPASIQLISAEEWDKEQSEPGSQPATEPAAQAAHSPEISTLVVPAVGLAPPHSTAENLPPALRVEPSLPVVKIPEAPAVPRVTVHIGRIEIRMAPRPAITPARKPAHTQRKPVMSLDSYLKQRSGEKS